MIRIWSFMLTLLALTACGELLPYRSGGYAPVVTLGYGTDYWLSELNQTRQMPPYKIRETAQTWEQEFQDDPGDSNRIKLALLLTVGDARVRDPERARELLEGLGEAPVNTSDRELVSIVRQIIDDQEQAGAAVDTLNRQIRKQRRRIKELEQQQRALTDIEQNIQQKEAQPDIENGSQ